ncbi:MAG: hypothetical protein J7494_12880 [Sphingobium sp.]|nr:hypothetical protein [Sphingobium sp.]
MTSKSHRRKSPLLSRCSLALVAWAIAASGPAGAQKPPADLTSLPPVPTDYTPKKTAWGDWDFSGKWPYDFAAQARILFQRSPGYGDRAWITPEEHAKRVENAKKADAAYDPEKTGISTQVGTVGMGKWINESDFSWRTSLIVSPRNGQLPPMTPKGQELFEKGRSGWVPGQAWDGPADFDTWDRCITRGFPASMFPNRYNNALEVYQSPGFIVIKLEMLGTRVIPIVDKVRALQHLPASVEAWFGDSRAYWEGKTLVIDTTNIKSGDAVSHDLSGRNAAPVIVTMVGGAPRNTIPTSKKAHAVERITMTGRDTILYQITYDDPEVFTAPWTAQLEWTRDNKYEFYEYACHEGNVQLRNYVSASRAVRAARAKGELANFSDGNERFTRPFDVDPVAPKPAGAAPAPSAPAATQTSK